jgi:hypothetical protein
MSIYRTCKTAVHGSLYSSKLGVDIFYRRTGNGQYGSRRFTKRDHTCKPNGWEHDIYRPNPGQ